MSLQEKKYRLIEEIFKVNDPDVLDRMEDMLSVPKQGLKLTSQQKLAIDEAISELEAGKGRSHASVMKETKKRFPKYFK